MSPKPKVRSTNQKLTIGLANRPPMIAVTAMSSNMKRDRSLICATPVRDLFKQKLAQEYFLSRKWLHVLSDFASAPSSAAARTSCLPGTPISRPSTRWQPTSGAVPRRAKALEMRFVQSRTEDAPPLPACGRAIAFGSEVRRYGIDGSSVARPSRSIARAMLLGMRPYSVP